MFAAPVGNPLISGFPACFRPTVSENRNAEAHASLDAQIERHKAIVGDSEDVLNTAEDAETEALGHTHLDGTNDKIAGVLALLELLPELRRSRVMDDD